jgi:hypothetical protein
MAYIPAVVSIFDGAKLSVQPAGTKPVCNELLHLAD